MGREGNQSERTNKCFLNKSQIGGMKVVPDKCLCEGIHPYILLGRVYTILLCAPASLSANNSIHVVIAFPQIEEEYSLWARLLRFCLAVWSYILVYQPAFRCVLSRLQRSLSLYGPAVFLKLLSVFTINQGVVSQVTWHCGRERLTSSTQVFQMRLHAFLKVSLSHGLPRKTYPSARSSLPPDQPNKNCLLSQWPDENLKPITMEMRSFFPTTSYRAYVRNWWIALK